MSIKSIISNNANLDEEGVWVVEGFSDFQYTDGRSSDQYLNEVFSKAEDLSTDSEELEQYIKDWPSEYHLSRNRSHLLKGLNFDRELRVLEVGCGCGAITRHLGEYFNNVVSIEGNIHRARLARKRTRDLDNVTIVCSPFQEIDFRVKFDLVVCVGVLEYSGYFVSGNDPYARSLECFSSALHEEGELIIAIENQFGLKYLMGAHEDHLGKSFVGIEGYIENQGAVRTFGRTKLQRMLENDFKFIEFLYPFPDYKIPQAVLSEVFVKSQQSSELISQIGSRDYSGLKHFLFNEQAAIAAISENDSMDFFANSFLVHASKANRTKSAFPQEAIIFSQGRKKKYSTVTKVKSAKGTKYSAEKSLVSNSPHSKCKDLSHIPDSSEWINDRSIATKLDLMLMQSGTSMSNIAQLLNPWCDKIRLLDNEQEVEKQTLQNFVDCTWPNSYIAEEKCVFIDQEWHYASPLNAETLILRAMFDYISRSHMRHKFLGLVKSKIGSSKIKSIGQELGFSLTFQNLREFIKFECWFQQEITGRKQTSLMFSILLFAFFPRVYAFTKKEKPRVFIFIQRLRSKLKSYLK